VGYKNGQRLQEKIPFRPELFVPNQTDAPSEYSCYDGTALSIRNFNNIKEAKGFLEQYSSVDNFKIYGTNNFPAQFISKHFPNDIEYNLNHLRLFNLDIETMSDEGFPEPKNANSKITAITVKDVKNDIFYVWGVKDFKPHLPNIVYKQYSLDTEKEMLADFIAFWQMNYPDIVSGWFIRTFDIPYLYNRITKICGQTVANKMSCWGIIWEKKTNTQKISTRADQQEYDIHGLSVLDYVDLYKKFQTGQEASYKLDHIAMINLGEKKLEYEGSLHQLFTNDYQKYVEYNIQDVSLIDKLENKLKYIELVLEISYRGKVPQYVDSLGTTRYWETLIYHDLYKKKIIPPIKTHGELKEKQFRGAYVKDPIPGKYKWVVDFDFSSLYPSLIRQLSIGPETIVKNVPQELQDLANSLTLEKLLNNEIDTSLLKKYNYSMGANGAFYKHEKSFLSELVGGIFDDRQVYRKQMIGIDQIIQKTNKEDKEPYYNLVQDKQRLDIKQLALKILINSVYGGLGTQYFQYYDVTNAEAVTVTGQYIIQRTEKEINKYLNILNKTTGFDFAIAMDTDSIFLNLAPIVDKIFKDQSNEQKITDFIDRLCKEKITPFMTNLFKDISEQLNCFENHLVMKREVIASVAIWKAKKRYAMSVLDKEGVRFEKPKFSVTGLEVVSSSTPMICQDKLEEGLKICLSGNEKQLQEFIYKFKNEFFSLDPREIAISKSVSDIEKYASLPKGTPFNARAALNFNRLLRKHSMEKTHESIKSGNKLKYVPLRMPNIIHDDVIGFIDKLPKEFGLHKYVDYNEQFEKVFLAPMRPIATILGWELEKRNKTSDFYA
jgi:DNA polymerase elongation subunit (family B)